MQTDGTIVQMLVHCRKAVPVYLWWCWVLGEKEERERDCVCVWGRGGGGGVDLMKSEAKQSRP